MRHYYPSRRNYYASKLDSLSNMNQNLVNVILKNLPGEFLILRDAFRTADSSDELRRLKRTFSEHAIEVSRQSTYLNRGYVYPGERCTCVLCGADEAAKRGIEKHLVPGAGADCPVMASIAEASQRDFEKTEAAEKEAEERRRRKAALAGRVYLTDMRCPPETAGDSSFSDRSQEEIDALNPRLEDMGFRRREEVVKDGVTEIRWEQRIDDAYVLADPLRKSGIEIRAWPRQEVEKMPKRRRKRCGYSRSETIYNHWKNDLHLKVRKAVYKILET